MHAILCSFTFSSTRCGYTMINEHYKIMAEVDETHVTANLQTSV